MFHNGKEMSLLYNLNYITNTQNVLNVELMNESIRFMKLLLMWLTYLYVCTCQ